jgi:hypothetical protein
MPPTTAKVRQPWLFVFALLCMLLSIGGFVMVADDWRHIGETVTCLSLLLAGIFFAIAAWHDSTLFAFEVMGAVLLLGLFPAAAFDRMLLGMSLSLLIGAGLSLWVARKRRTKSGGFSQ